MNDELKATIEWLTECGNNDYLFETGNSKMLLDYITNLQHTEDLYNQLLKDYDEEVEENIKLTKLWKNEVEKRRKAVEYIENNWIEYSDFQYVDNDDELNIDCESIKKLLDILNGKE